jgi:spore germination protein
MIIYVVQEGDTIVSIADRFQVSEARLIIDNGITFPNDLVIGQTIVITYPKETYIVVEGDTLDRIAINHGISMTQLYRNNAYLWDSNYIYPGQTLVISYDTKGEIMTSGYAFPYIDKEVLRKSLPNLTYLSILNYKTIKKGEIETFYDDSDLIETVKQFGVIPIMLVTSITFRGERDPEMIYGILLNPAYQDAHAQNMLKILKQKGYYGVNITITFLNETTQELYLNYLKRITSILKKEGFTVFITIDPNFVVEEKQTVFEEVDYSEYSDLVDAVYLMRFYWGTQYGPPRPVSSVENIRLYVNYIEQAISPDKINIGFPLLGYDWKLPYIQGFSQANAITLDSAINLARLNQSIIYFEEVSKTPFFNYEVETSGSLIGHEVWFVDARTIDEICNLVLENEIQGIGLWNIMSNYPQLWLVINSTFQIVKLLPEI